MELSKTRLFVSNFPYEADEREIKEHFLCYGTVKDVLILTDRETQRSRGIGFVEMLTPAAAEKALAADGSEIGGRRIKVAFAEERKRRNQNG